MRWMQRSLPLSNMAPYRAHIRALNHRWAALASGTTLRERLKATPNLECAPHSWRCAHEQTRPNLYGQLMACSRCEAMPPSAACFLRTGSHNLLRGITSRTAVRAARPSSIEGVRMDGPPSSRQHFGSRRPKKHDRGIELLWTQRKGGACLSHFVPTAHATGHRRPVVFQIMFEFAKKIGYCDSAAFSFLRTCASATLR